jgi:hypothetical protein
MEREASSGAESPAARPTSGAAPLAPLGRLKQVLRGERAPEDAAEVAAALTEMARRKSGRLPPALVVAQVLRVTAGTDWPTQRAALEALLRRVGFAQRDGLEIADRPARGAVLGRYVLAREKARGGAGGGGLRPYQTALYGLEPLGISCDCADFVRSSLGVCKHLLVVLEDLAAAPQRWRAGLAEAAAAVRPELGWDPVRSWTGAGDRLAGLRWLPREPTRDGANRRAVDRAFVQGQPDASMLADLQARVSWLEQIDAASSAGELDAEPAAAAVVRAELALARRRRTGRATVDAALGALGTLRRSLYPYQREGVQRFLEEQRLLLADDMGLGKTTQAIAACHALYEAGRVRRGLLIVPAPLKEQWLREWTATTDRVPIALVEGNAKERAQRYRETRDGYLVTNYEQLIRDIEVVQAYAPELCVLDEAQRIKNWATKSNAYVMSLDPAWRLVLTGTPLENRLEELATLLDWVDDAALAPKWRLGPWHTEWSADGAARVGARHLDTLRQRVSHCVVRRVRHEVLRQLPPRTDVRVPVEMTEAQREQHDALVVPIARLLQAARRRPLRQAEFLRLMQLLAQQRIISNGLAQYHYDEVWPTYSRAPADEALLAACNSPKLLEFRRVLADLVCNQGRKVVVFSQWRKMLRLAEWSVRGLLDAEGYRSVFFTGEESQATRANNVDVFHEDPSIRVMFLSDAGGVGLNLQHAASACINLELPWNPAVLEQRIGRIYRLGQDQPIDVINLVTEYGIESRIAALIGNKRALFSGLFDGTSDTVRFDAPAGFLEDIQRLVEPVVVPELGSDASEDPSDGAEDGDSVAGAEGDGPHDGGVVATAMPAPDPEARIAAATSSPASPPRPPSLFDRLSVTRTENGGLRIEAPPEAAEELTQLLQRLSEMLAAGRA